MLQLGNQLTKMGHEIHWLTARIPNTKEYEPYHGIHIHRIPILSKNRFYFPGRQTFPFMVMLQKVRLSTTDGCYSNKYACCRLYWLETCKKYNKPSLLFCHEFYGALWNKVGSTLLERRVYPTIEMRIARFPLVISILKQLDVYKGVKDEEEHHKY